MEPFDYESKANSTAHKEGPKPGIFAELWTPICVCVGEDKVVTDCLAPLTYIVIIFTLIS